MFPEIMYILQALIPFLGLPVQCSPFVGVREAVHEFHVFAKVFAG